MNSNTQAKQFTIAKREVYGAWLHVRSNAGASGLDGESMASFEANLSKNLYKLWNRMSSGSYFPKAVKRVEIPKKDGGVRPLVIPTVGDRIAQEVVRMRLEPLVEPKFHKDSYDFRLNKSGIDAVRMSLFGTRGSSSSILAVSSIRVPDINSFGFLGILRKRA